MDPEITTSAGLEVMTIAGYGIPALGFVFLWYFMKQYFKLVEKTSSNESTLKMLTEVMSKVGDLREAQIEYVLTTERLVDEIGDQTKLLQGISDGIMLLVRESHIINVAAEKGYMDRQQGREVVSE